MLQDRYGTYIGLLIFHFSVWITIGCRGRYAQQMSPSFLHPSLFNEYAIAQLNFLRPSFLHRSLWDGDIRRFTFSYNVDGYVIFRDGGFHRVFIVQSPKDKDTVKLCAEVYHKMRKNRYITR